MTTETTNATAPLPLKPGRWLPDPLHSAVGFTIRHLGISKVTGRFAAFEAELTVGETAAGTEVSATVDLASLDTGNPQRDDHVRAPELLDVARRPTMTFRSTRVHGTGDDWTMEGELTIGDVTRPVSFAVGFGGLVDVPMDGSRHAGFEARGRLRRSDFGLDFGPGADAVIGDVVRIELDMQFVEPR